MKVSLEDKAPFVVPASRSGLGKVVAGAGCFCAVGFVTFADMPSRFPQVVRDVFGTVLLVILPFFAFCGLYAAYRLVTNEPMLVVDGEGIIDHSSLIGVGRIYWDEISAIRPSAYRGQRMLSILPVDDRVISRQRSAIHRWCLRFNHRRGFGIAIAVSFLSVSVSELQHEIEGRRPRQRRSER